MHLEWKVLPPSQICTALYGDGMCPSLYNCDVSRKELQCTVSPKAGEVQSY